MHDETSGRPVDVVMYPVIGLAVTDHGNGCFSATPIDIGGGHSDEIVAAIEGNRWWLTGGGGSGFDPIRLKQALLAAGDEDE